MTDLIDRKPKRRRIANTSLLQVEEYLKAMESDNIFRTNTVNPTLPPDYIDKCWEKLTAKLNSCDSGPCLSTKEWIKRFNDWKNNTRSKYRKMVSNRVKTGGGEEESIKLAPLEDRALNIWGKIAVTGSNKVPVVGGLQLEQVHQIKTAQLSLEEIAEPITIITETDDNILQAEVDESLAIFSAEDTSSQNEVVLKPYPQKEATQKLDPGNTKRHCATVRKNFKDNKSTKSVGQELLLEFKKDVSNRNEVSRVAERRLEPDIAKFRFEVAKYKFENPGFHFDIDI